MVVSMSKMNNISAFARPHSEDKDFIHFAQSGMTLRDYFAASFVESGHIFKIISDGNTPELVAEQAYALADAMMKAREA